MKRRAIIMLTLLAGVLSGCKQHHYPGVPEIYRDYFPYKKGDSITFSNGQKEIGFRIHHMIVDEDRDTNIALDWMIAHPEIFFSSRPDHFSGTFDPSIQSFINGTLRVNYPDLKGAHIQVNIKFNSESPEFIFTADITSEALPDSIMLKNHSEKYTFFNTSTIKKEAVSK